MVRPVPSRCRRIVLNPTRFAATGIVTRPALRGLTGNGSAMSNGLLARVPAAAQGTRFGRSASLQPHSGETWSRAEQLAGGLGRCVPGRTDINGVKLLPVALCVTLRSKRSNSIVRFSCSGTNKRFAGSAGRWRGGSGIVFEFQLLVAARARYRRADGTIHRLPWGREGGFGGTLARQNH